MDYLEGLLLIIKAAVININNPLYVFKYRIVEILNTRGIKINQKNKTFGQ